MPFKSVENLRLVRINPEYIDIKYNDSTGRHTYLYSIPDKLKRQIMAGDPDIMEDTPKIYIDAIKQRKKIKLSNQNLFHLKLPTLAGKDMGWGMPPIAVALKDLFHFYTLRRGQEAVMLEHIVPFDIIFPQANGKFDPYVHSDLSNWKREIESQLAKKRRDPNYKAILPSPVGYERISGDGKNLLLTPELDFLAKSIIGACGIPQEFVFGGNMQWSGSSISLRTLENDFLHHRSQLLQMDIWLMDRLRTYLDLPTPKSIKFSDFKMADDVQKLQMIIGMASNDKLDWDDIYKEMGKDPQVVRERIRQQKHFDAEMQEQDMLVQTNAAIKAQRIQQRATPQPQQLPADPLRDKSILAFAKKLSEEDPVTQEEAIKRLEKLDPDFAAQVQAVLERRPHGARQRRGPTATISGAYASCAGATASNGSESRSPRAPTLRPMPTQKPPRRQGGNMIAPDYRVPITKGIQETEAFERSPFIQGLISGSKSAHMAAPIADANQAMRGKDPIMGGLLAALATGAIVGTAKYVGKDVTNQEQEGMLRYHIERMKQREPLLFLPPPPRFGALFSRFHDAAHGVPRVTA